MGNGHAMAGTAVSSGPAPRARSHYRAVLTDPGRVLGWLASIVAPRGALVTVVPNHTGLRGLYHRLWKPATFQTHRPVTLTGLSTWYRASGLRVGAWGALGSVVPTRLPRRAIRARHLALYRVLWPTVLRPLTWGIRRACLLGYRGFGLQVEGERFSPSLYAIGRRAPEATS